MAEVKMVKVVHFRRIDSPGMAQGPQEFRVFEQPKNVPLPGQAFIVDDSTPLSDWAPEPDGFTPIPVGG